MVKTENNTLVAGKGFAEAVRRLLPRSPTKDLGGITIEPGASGALRIVSFYASEELAAEGAWSDSVMVSGRFLRNIIKGSPPATIRLTYSSGKLIVNGTAITAALAPIRGEASKPRYVPTNRLGRRV